jgi:hypothetical protein
MSRSAFQATPRPQPGRGPSSAAGSRALIWNEAMSRATHRTVERAEGSKGAEMGHDGGASNADVVLVTVPGRSAMMVA